MVRTAHQTIILQYCNQAGCDGKHVACMARKRFVMRKPERHVFVDLGVDGTIILKYTLLK